MSDERRDVPRIHDPNSPATPFQRQKLVDLGVDKNAAADPRLTKQQASDWIDGCKAAGREERPIPTAPPATPGPEPPGFRPASEMARPPEAAPPVQPPAPPTAAAVYEERDEDRGPLTPVQVMTQQEREQYGLGETETVVLPGRKDEQGTKIVPEFGMPAKYLFARISRKPNGQIDVRVFPSIEGLTFRANAYAQGIKTLQFEYVKPEEIPGFAAFAEETKDPQIIARVTVALGNGATIVEEGTVRLSEIQLHRRARDGKMVARSPVARTNYLEIAKKRALARALRWGTGYGGTALDELPPDEQDHRALSEGGKRE